MSIFVIKIVNLTEIWLIHKSIILEELNTSCMIFGDALALVRASLIYLFFSIQTTLISFLSIISLIAAMSTNNLFLSVCLVL